MVVDLTSGPEGQWFKCLNYPPDNRGEAHQCFHVDAGDPLMGCMHGIISMENLHADEKKTEAAAAKGCQQRK